MNPWASIDRNEPQTYKEDFTPTSEPPRGRKPVVDRIFDDRRDLSPGGRAKGGAVGKDLTSEDIARSRDLLLGQHVMPGSANARLIGGKWRHVPNVLPDKPMFTE
jgi:hypothetical protein